MELKEVLEKRHSCRAFAKDQAVPWSSLHEISWAGDRAPYASGGPRRSMGLVTDPDQIDLLQAACFNQQWVGQCGAAFVIAGRDPGAVLRSGHPKYVHDCDAAAMCMILRAVDLGLGVCWIGHFDPARVATAAGLREDQRPVVVLIVGVEDGLG